MPSQAPVDNAIATAAVAGKTRSLHARDKGVACRIFAETGACFVSKCPYMHVTADTRRPVPPSVCSYYLRYRCLRDDCPFFHLPQERFDALVASGVAEYCPLDGVPVRDPLAALSVEKPFLPSAELTGARPADVERAAAETAQRIAAAAEVASTNSSGSGAHPTPSQQLQQQQRAAQSARRRITSSTENAGAPLMSVSVGSTPNFIPVSSTASTPLVVSPPQHQSTADSVAPLSASFGTSLGDGPLLLHSFPLPSTAAPLQHLEQVPPSDKRAAGPITSIATAPPLWPWPTPAPSYYVELPHHHYLPHGTAAHQVMPTLLEAATPQPTAAVATPAYYVMATHTTQPPHLISSQPQYSTPLWCFNNNVHPSPAFPGYYSDCNVAVPQPPPASSSVAILSMPQYSSPPFASPAPSFPLPPHSTFISPLPQLCPY